MTSLNSSITRRHFVATTGLAASVTLLAPHNLFAESDGLVETARKTAAARTITVQKLRGNVSVLMGGEAISPFFRAATGNF